METPIYTIQQHWMENTNAFYYAATDKDKLLEEIEEIDRTPQQPVELETSFEEDDALSGEETLALDEAEVDLTEEALEFGEAEELELETEGSPLEIGGEVEGLEAEEDAFEIEEGVEELEGEEAALELDEEIEDMEGEGEEIPLELEPSEEDIALESEDEGPELGELIEEEISAELIQPEAFEPPPEPRLSVDEPEEAPAEVGKIELVQVGAPQKISATSIKVPLSVRLTEINKEAKITLVIQLEEFLIQ